MSLNDIQKAAKKIDEAHESQIQHAYKKHRPSLLKRLLVIFVTILLVIGVPFLGFRGVTYVLQSFQTQEQGDIGEQEEEIIIDEEEVIEVEEEEETDDRIFVVPEDLEVMGAIDSSDLVDVISADPLFRGYQKPIEGSLEAFNLSLEVQRRKPTVPLAINQLHGATDSALGAVFSSMGFAEVDRELLTSQAGTSSIALGTNLGQPIADPLTLEAKTLLLSRIDNVLSLDPYVVVGTGYSREQAYVNLVRELTNLLSVSQKVQEDLKTELTTLGDQINDYKGEQSALQKEFAEGTESLETQGLETQLKTLNEVSSKLITAQQRKEALTSLQAFYEARVSTLILRIEATEKNRDALIKNVKVTPVEGSGVQVTE
jgi:hypothetical protein